MPSFFWNRIFFQALCIQIVSFCSFSHYFTLWPPLVILYLQVLTISHGNIVWRMFYEVGDFSRWPQGKKHNPLMMIRKLNGQINVMKVVDWLGCQSLLICDSTYLELMNLTQAWEKLEVVFGKHNEIRGHRLKKWVYFLKSKWFFLHLRVFI